MWNAIHPGRARALTEARLQVHHAAQFASALGISYLARRDDDGNTNLEWDSSLGALLSNPVPVASSAVRVGLRVADLTLVVADAGGHAKATHSLAGRTISDAQAWLATKLGREGLDAERYTLTRHFEIPPHAVARGAPFDAGDPGAFEEIARWFGNGAMVLGALGTSTPGASPVRCWPHHFDIAMLISVAPDKSVGAGLEPGDAYYEEPYFYVNAHPQPSREQLTDHLDGQGSWHTHEWIGAVLPGSRLGGNATEQERQVRTFLDSASAACRRLLTTI